MITRPLKMTPKIIIACAFLATLVASKDVDPKTLFDLCKKGDPNVNECFKNAIQTAFPKFVNGIPQLNIPPLEPIKVDKATIGEGTGTVHVTQNYKNMELHNILRSTIVKVETTITDTQLKMKIETFNPLIKMISDYDFNGRILVLPIVGNGKSEISLKDVSTNVNLDIDTYEKKGKKYGKITNISVEYEPKGAHFNFENLFNGDKRLGDQMNTILNENWRDVFLDVKSGYENLVATVLSTYINLVFNNIEFDKLFS